MTKIFRMCGSEFRDWHKNAKVLVGPDGQIVALEKPGETTAKPFREWFRGRLQAWHPGLNISLRAPNNKYIEFIRAAGVSAPPVSPQLAPPNPRVPSPESCGCREYAGTTPGQHHDLCQYNAKFQGATVDVGTFSQPLTTLPPTLLAPPPAPNARMPRAVDTAPPPQPAPSEAAAPPEPDETGPFYLFSVEGELQREASPEEVQEAASSVLPLLQIGDAFFTVARKQP